MHGKNKSLYRNARTTQLREFVIRRNQRQIGLPCARPRGTMPPLRLIYCATCAKSLIPCAACQCARYCSAARGSTLNILSLSFFHVDRAIAPWCSQAKQVKIISVSDFETENERTRFSNRGPRMPSFIRRPRSTTRIKNTAGQHGKPWVSDWDTLNTRENQVLQ
jgi:hypothetical protein